MFFIDKPVDSLASDASHGAFLMIFCRPGHETSPREGCLEIGNENQTGMNGINMEPQNGGLEDDFPF